MCEGSSEAHHRGCVQLSNGERQKDWILKINLKSGSIVCCVIRSSISHASLSHSQSEASIRVTWSLLTNQQQYQPRFTLSQPIRGQCPGHVINLSQWAAVSVTRHSLTVSSHIHRSRFQPISAVLLTPTPTLTLTWFLISLKQIWTIWHTMPPTLGVNVKYPKHR